MKNKNKSDRLVETLMYIFSCTFKGDIEKGSTWIIKDGGREIHRVKNVKAIKEDAHFTEFYGLQDGKAVQLARVRRDFYTLAYGIKDVDNET